MVPASIWEFAQELALAAVAVQSRFDREANDAARHLGIPRLRLTSFSIATNLTLIEAGTSTLSLAIQPVNVAFQITHDLREETLSRISLTIEQTPRPLIGKA